jgi:hypothetical protein
MVMDGVAAGLSLKSSSDVQENSQISDSSKQTSKNNLRASQGLYWTSMGLTLISGATAWFWRDSVALPLASSMISAIVAAVGAGIVGGAYSSIVATQQERDKIQDATAPALATGITATVLDWASLAYITWLVTCGRSATSSMHTVPH